MIAGLRSWVGFIRHMLAIGLLLAVASCATPRSAGMDETLAARLTPGLARGYPGIAMIVRDRDGGVHGAAIGYADLERRLALRLGDRFHIGSITKAFTAIAVLQLVDAGQLRLDTPIGNILGDAVARIPNADRITVGQLLDHSSGIYPTNNDPDYLAELVGARADPRRRWSFEEMIAFADGRRHPPAHAPGAGHRYSDTNYNLLGMIVERVTGRAFKDHVRDTLLRPLGMHSTGFYSDAIAAGGRLPHPRVQGYFLETPDIRSVLPVNPMFPVVTGIDTPAGTRLLNTTLAAERLDAAGGIVSTLPDLLRFADALFHGRLLSPASQAFLMAAGDGMDQVEMNADRTRALQAVRKPFGVVIDKQGDGPGGATAIMGYVPARDQIFIGFVNRFGGDFDHIDFLLDEVVGRLNGE